MDEHGYLSIVDRLKDSVKAPQAIAAWTGLPRSRVGKVLRPDVRAELLAPEQPRVA